MTDADEQWWNEQILGEATKYMVPIKVAMPENPKKLYGDKKLPVHLVPPVLVLETAVAMGEGAEKYGPYNWRDSKVCATTYVGAMGRHLAAYADGEDVDPESSRGKTHLAGIAACVAILMDAGRSDMLVDDRKKGPAPEMTRTPATKGDQVNFAEYEMAALATDSNPAITKGNIVYQGLALAGEAGELANEVKKFIRDDGSVLTDERRVKMILEAGDVLWYLQGFARQIGSSLEDIATANINKLSKRRVK